MVWVLIVIIGFYALESYYVSVPDVYTIELILEVLVIDKVIVSCLDLFCML